MISRIHERLGDELVDPVEIRMIAWEDPDFDAAAGKTFLFPGLEARARAAPA